MGVLVRGWERERIFGYSRNLGVSPVLETELQVILDGFKTSWEEGVCPTGN